MFCKCMKLHLKEHVEKKGGGVAYPSLEMVYTEKYNEIKGIDFPSG